MTKDIDLIDLAKRPGISFTEEEALEEAETRRKEVLALLRSQDELDNRLWEARI